MEAISALLNPQPIPRSLHQQIHDCDSRLHCCCVLPSALIFDLRELEYEWGNTIWNMFRCEEPFAIPVFYIPELFRMLHCGGLTRTIVFLHSTQLEDELIVRQIIPSNRRFDMSNGRQRAIELVAQTKYARFQCDISRLDELQAIEDNRRNIISGFKGQDMYVLRKGIDELRDRRVEIMNSVPKETKQLRIVRENAIDKTRRPSVTYQPPFDLRVSQSCSPPLSFVTPDDHTDAGNGIVGSGFRFAVTGIDGPFQACFDSSVIMSYFRLTEPAPVLVRCALEPRQSCVAAATFFRRESNSFYGDVWQFHQPFITVDGEGLSSQQVFVLESGITPRSLHTAEFFEEMLNGSFRRIINNPPFGGAVTFQTDSHFIDPGPNGMELCIGVGMRHWVTGIAQHINVDVVSTGDWLIKHVDVFADPQIIH
jgi:hypothetical protein